jgi:hypothetical protein
MTLSDLGDLGDLLGGIGVIATLVYLSLQIRANTREVRAASLDTVATSHFEIQRILGQEPGLAKIWFDGLKGEVELSEVDAQRFWFLLLTVARRWERAFLKSRSGTLDTEAWAGIEAEYIAIFSNPGAKSCWKSIRRGFSSDFVEFVNSATQLGGKTS